MFICEYFDAYKNYMNWL